MSHTVQRTRKIVDLVKLRMEQDGSATAVGVITVWVLAIKKGGALVDGPLAGRANFRAEFGLGRVHNALSHRRECDCLSVTDAYDRAAAGDADIWGSRHRESRGWFSGSTG